MKSYKREVGAILLTAGLATLWWFTSLDSPELVKAYAPAIPGIIFALVGGGIAPFGIHYIFDKQG